MGSSMRSASPSIMSMSSTISPRSPLWVEDEYEQELPVRELDLDCGSKSGIARSVSVSPRRYSGAFSSQVPRFGQTAYYASSDPRQLGAKDRGVRSVYDAAAQQPHLCVREPDRPSTVFRSNVARFGAQRTNGLHPNSKIPQPSFEVENSKLLEFDRSSWSRAGFFHSRGPRLQPQQRPMTADLDAPDLSAAAHHVDAMHLPLRQCVAVCAFRLASHKHTCSYPMA